MVDKLLDALAANPENALLRMAVIRSLISAASKSTALELALPLRPEDVEAPEDRILIAGLLEEAGLDGQTWRGRPDEPRLGQGHQEAPAVSELSAEPARTLRVVGGKEAGNQGPVPLPEPGPPPVAFAQVGGLSDVKRDIERRIIAPFTQRGLFDKFKKRTGGGVLLYGPPGCGKTMLARATAGECRLPFQTVSIPEILDPLSGMSERRLSGLFENVRARAPAVIFFDEIDALASKRTLATATHTAQLVSHFLAELDGVNQNNQGLLLLAATNIPWAIDPAFMRHGRFDRLFFVPPPDKEARERILELELAGRPQSNDVNLRAVVEKTSSFSGADLAAVVERAADAAIDASMERGAEVAINQQMLLASAREVKSSVLDWLTTARNYATYSNESGRYDEILAFLQKNSRG